MSEFNQKENLTAEKQAEEKQVGAASAFAGCGKQRAEKKAGMDPCAGCTLNCGSHGFHLDSPAEHFADDKKSVPIYVVLVGILAALFAGGLLSSYVINLLFH